MSTDFRGDPSAALLEVLDPEQNHTFNDHYLDLDYDLSNVMFITTANTLHSIPVPLQDRMEVIQLAGYTELEKLTIAAQLPDPQAEGSQRPRRRGRRRSADEAIRIIIHRYTREAGVRSLEREIAAVCRKVARDVLKNGKRADAGRPEDDHEVPGRAPVPLRRGGARGPGGHRHRPGLDRAWAASCSPPRPR